jgi:hypothetical protein
MMDVIEAAEEAIEQYTMRRLNAALHSQKVCGCRACTARAYAWADWAAGDDEDLYEALHIFSKWEQVR